MEGGAEDVCSGSFPSKKFRILSRKLCPSGTLALNVGVLGHSGGGTGGSVAQPLKIAGKASNHSLKALHLLLDRIVNPFLLLLLVFPGLAHSLDL